MSLARYMMSVHLGRILEKNEHVDHIDNNKNNDIISNLQILTQKANNEKYSKLHPKKQTEMICPVCGNTFMMDNRFLPFRKNPTCSKSCGYKKSVQSRNKIVN